MAWVEQTPFGAFGPPPQLHGGDVSGMAAALLRQRMAQQEQPLEVAKLMQQARQQQLANALAQREMAIREQQAQTYPVSIGDQTFNLKGPQAAQAALTKEGYKSGYYYDENGKLQKAGVPGTDGLGVTGKEWVIDASGQW